MYYLTFADSLSPRSNLFSWLRRTKIKKNICMHQNIGHGESEQNMKIAQEYVGSHHKYTISFNMFLRSLEYRVVNKHRVNDKRIKARAGNLVDI